MNTPSTLKAVATGQQTAQEARDPYTVFKGQLERVKGELLPLLGNSKQNVDAFIRVVLNAVNQNPALLGADRRSLLTACTRAAQDGLVPDGREAVLNIRNTKVKRDGREQWIDMVVYEPMVAGYIKNLYEHPDVALVDSAAVFANDHFKFVRGDAPRLEHEPNLTDDPGPLVAAYLVVHLKNGQIKREVMPMRDIQKVRAVSKSGDGASSPWVKWPDQMAIKSVIKRGAKQLPRSNKFEQMDEHDNEVAGYASTESTASLFHAGNEPVPALEHQPGEILEHGHIETREPVAVGDDNPGAGNAAAAGQEGAGAANADAPKVTYTALLTRLNKTKDREVAGLIVDEGRTALNAEEQQALQAAFDKRFPAQE